MKKIITVSLLTLTLNATAGWGGNSGPWGNSGWNNGPWGGNNNGIFGSNPYSMFTPDWFSEEMDDFMDEFDNNEVHGVTKVLIEVHGVTKALIEVHGVIKALIEVHGVIKALTMVHGAITATICRFQFPRSLIKQTLSNRII